MTAPGRYAASDNSFTKSTATAAARGGGLIALAIVIGVLLLWQGYDGDDSVGTAADDSDETTDETSDETSDEADETSDEADERDTSNTNGGDDADGTANEITPAAPVVPDSPNSVKVAVLNGRGETGLAGSRSDHLKTAGYVSIAANADTSDKEFSRVYYIPGYADEAELVAVALNGSPTVTEMAPADPLTLVSEPHREEATDYHIYVVLGADAVLG